MKAGDDGFSIFAFSPTLLFSYRLNKRNILRLRLDSETMMPDIQQMSGNRILIMENFYRRGNADVHNSTGYQSRLIYSYYVPRKLIVQADAHYNRTGGFLYDSFVQDGGAWYLETCNAHHYSETGMNMIVTYLPWKWLRLGVDFSADRQTIKETASSEAYGDWLFPVYLNASGLAESLKEKGVKVLLVSPLKNDVFRDNQQMVDEFLSAGIKVMMMPQAEEWDGREGTLSHSRLHEVAIEDLLPREKIEVDMDAIGTLLTGKRILITGAAGSIGSEMVRQVAKYHPAEMILIDQAETPMHDIRLMMQRQYPDIKNETIVTSIANGKHMESIFREHRPEYVFHAAAYKHVPMMEDDPAIAVQNNIYGTRVIADLAVKYGTKKFVMISTDKAVNPTNVMGCSKRICEIYCQSLNQAIQEGKVQGVTQFVTTRFGNVLGSNGSVIPIFREQIQNGGPVTVTHPDIIRYFMLIPEACKLVLEAGTMGKGGEIFVFDMGKPVKIVDLAKRMIQLSGATNVEIRFTGLRDGEKLYEEVLSDKEGNLPTTNPKIMVAQVRKYDYETACENERRLMEVSETFNDMAIVKVMKEIVPEYRSRQSKYEALDMKES